MKTKFQSRKKSFATSALMLLFIFTASLLQLRAQTAEDIVDKYVAAIGGKDAWTKVKGIRIKAKVDAQGMTLPLDIINMSDGRNYTSFELQGKVVVQSAFDGETAWGVNFMTMKAEKHDNETTENIKREAKDFPNSFSGYKEKGYKIKLMGKEMAEGVNCYKIKLTKKTQLVDGKEEENIVYYYFDVENFVPIMEETTINSGEAKGQISQTVYSDYQEVGGLYFPYSIMSRLKDGAGQSVVIQSIELNPTVEDKLFKFSEN